MVSQKLPKSELFSEPYDLNTTQKFLRVYMGDQSCFQTVATMRLKLQPEDLCNGKKVLSTANIIRQSQPYNIIMF
jgi:hypothetical protein